MDFKTMLNEVYKELDGNKKTTIKLPEIELNKSTTNTYWTNVKPILKLLKRKPDDFMNILKIKLDRDVNWLSKSISDGIIIKGKIKTDVIQNFLIYYVNTYIVCSTCKSVNTKCEYSSNIKKYNIMCKDCLSTYSV